MKNVFPYRFFWNLFFAFFLLVIIIQVVLISAASYLYDFSFFNIKILVLVLVFLPISALAGVGIAYRFSKPLKNVILGAIRLSGKKSLIDDSESEEILNEDYGDYFELERALEKARRKLAKRRMQLDKEREESQTLMIAIEDAVVSCDLEFRIQYFNSRFAKQFMPKSLSQIRHVFREPEVNDLFEKTVSTGQAQVALFKLNSFLDVSPRHYSLTISPLREEKTHELYGVLALFHDITEMKKTEQIRIEFVQNASHELRTPLTSMKGYIETLKEDLSQKNYEQAESFLKIISKSVDRLTELVSDMLTIANLEGPTLMHKENTNINLLSQEVIERLAPLASEKNIFIHYKSDVDHWFVDAQKVEQVLVNLLSNAIKYIPVNGQVDIFWKQLHGELELHVVDNGPGIAPEHLSRLFERFYRVDKGRARDVGGTGLGLSIVKHIVQAHGGQVGVHSKPGEGSDFYCIFPA